MKRLPRTSATLCNVKIQIDDKGNIIFWKEKNSLAKILTKDF